MGVKSITKEFASLGENSFFYEETLIWKGFVVRENEVKVTKPVFLLRYSGKSWR